MTELAEQITHLQNKGHSRLKVARALGVCLGYVDYYKPGKRGDVTDENKRKGMRWMIQELDRLTSLVVRARDGDQGCISCGVSFGIADRQAQCGHFIKREYYPRRWCLENCNAQCARCNGYLEGNYAGYYRGLKARYGEEKAEELYLEGERWRVPSKYDAQEQIENRRPSAAWLNDEIMRLRDEVE